MGDNVTRLVASNLIADHRVSDHCAQLFLSLYNNHLTANAANSLSNALTDYRRLIALNPDRTFLHLDNSSNFIATDPPRTLAHVWNMTSYCLRNAKPADLHAHPITGLPSKLPTDVAGLNNLLSTFLASRPDAIDDLVRFRNAIHATPGRAGHPAWAADNADLSLLRVPGDPASWFFPLGLNLNPGGQALLALVIYQQPSDLQLIRPTQLEASNNPHHLPSPPCHPRDHGGLALRMDAPYSPKLIPTSRMMVREYLHPEIPFNPAWIAEIVAPAASLSIGSNDFLELRDDQFKRFRSAFKGKLGTWPRILPKKKDLP